MAKTKTSAAAIARHEVGKDGHCGACGRSGGDLKPPCPGYMTAAEHIDWSKQKPLAPTSTKKARKEKRK